MKKLETLNDGLLEELRDLYSAESQLLKALPKMEKRATNQKLKDGFRSHLLETEGQLERLDQIGDELDVKLSGKVCKAMQGLIEEGKEAIDATSENSALIDALLIGAARRVEHYEIAAYCTARTMAQELDLDNVVSLLNETFNEETAADKNLSLILAKEVAVKANQDDVDTKSKLSGKDSSAFQKKGSNSARLLGLLGFVLISYGTPSVANCETKGHEKTARQAASQYKGDNTGRNLGDNKGSRPTASDQKLGGAEIDILSEIRKELVANDNLSTNAHNVKIVVENRKVTLRGPVKSVEERAWIQATAERVAAGYTVVNHIDVTPK